MKVLNIALPVPLRSTFDYLPGDYRINSLSPGTRILVPFGRNQKKVGVLLKVSGETTINPAKLKTILSPLDTEPVISKAEMQLLEWTADYYHHPIGEVIFNALPAQLRKGKPASSKTAFGWSLSEAGIRIKHDEMARAPKQLALLKLLADKPGPLTTAEIEPLVFNARASLAALQKKGLLTRVPIACSSAVSEGEKDPVTLGSEQSQISRKLINSLGSYRVFLLDGVTGSGKTEVYISVMQAAIDQGKQVLVLSPEIGLTPQLLDRVNSRLTARVSVLHSGLSDTERLQAWLDAKNGKADIIIGTRSAVWTSLKNPGLIIVDEEHDLSYKQQDGLRYSARDIAVMRGKLSGAPVILGSATPSMESLHNTELNKFELLSLDKRAGKAQSPDVKIIDLRNRVMKGVLSGTMLDAIDRELSKRKQVMLFLNRRGYSPVIMCHSCAWTARCDRCDMNMTYHKQRNSLSCHHCDRLIPLPEVCPDCGANDLLEIGHGTERLFETLSAQYPDARIVRIDRDSTRRKGSMENMLSAIRKGDADILVGTQMLAKGHHFPDLTLVGIVDADGGLCSTDFRASERMAQLFIQVSGRAGREESTGSVLLQTHFPEHPLLKTLIEHGYREFARLLLEERKQTGLPPYSYIALIRSEGQHQDLQARFLKKTARLIKDESRQLQVYGPYPAPIEKRAGKIRMQLLVLSRTRAALRRAMQASCPAIEKLPEAKKVRWSLDIDPQDMM